MILAWDTELAADHAKDWGNVAAANINSGGWEGTPREGAKKDDSLSNYVVYFC